jgi:hypothetical protein
MDICRKGRQVSCWNTQLRPVVYAFRNTLPSHADVSILGTEFLLTLASLRAGSQHIVQRHRDVVLFRIAVFFKLEIVT